MKTNWKSMAAGLALLVGLSGAAFGADRDHDADRGRNNIRVETTTAITAGTPTAIVTMTATGIATTTAASTTTTRTTATTGTGSTATTTRILIAGS